MPERIVVSFQYCGPLAARQHGRDRAVARPPRRARAGAAGSAPKARAAAPAALHAAEENYLARALALKKRAEALGATLCAWSAQTFSFEFTADDDRGGGAARRARRGGRAVHPDARFAVGVAQGEMTYVGEAGRFRRSPGGSRCSSRVMLARVALPGDVLLDPRSPP